MPPHTQDYDKLLSPRHLANESHITITFEANKR